VEIINADTHPLQNLSAQERHSSDPTERKAWAKYFIEEGLEAYSKRLIYFESLGLRGKDDGTSLGSGFTAADLTLVPQLYNALRYDVDLTRWPRFLRIWEHSKTLRSYQASEPSQFEPS
jgi:glutathione S-transferase